MIAFSFNRLQAKMHIFAQEPINITIIEVSQFTISIVDNTILFLLWLFLLWHSHLHSSCWSSVLTTLISNTEHLFVHHKHLEFNRNKSEPQKGLYSQQS